jgi:uncharacterized DUF497 family protein
MSLLFDWDEANIAHIAEHGISTGEAEEVVTNNPLDLEYTVRNGEARLRQAGETSTGRILAVVTVMRSGRIRVVTAYPASRSLRATYLEHKSREHKELGKDGKTNSP